MTKSIENTKHFFSLIGFLFSTAYKVIRDKRTWVMIGLLLAFYLWGWANANYYMNDVKDWHIIEKRQSVKPIKNARVMPVVMAQVIKPTSLPKTEEEIVKGQKYGEELWNIYMLESTRGKNDGCRREGKFGGFGVQTCVLRMES